MILIRGGDEKIHKLEDLEISPTKWGAYFTCIAAVGGMLTVYGLFVQFGLTREQMKTTDNQLKLTESQLKVMEKEYKLKTFLSLKVNVRTSSSSKRNKYKALVDPENIAEENEVRIRIFNSGPGLAKNLTVTDFDLETGLPSGRELLHRDFRAGKTTYISYPRTWVDQMVAETKLKNLVIGIDEFAVSWMDVDDVQYSETFQLHSSVEEGGIDLWISPKSEDEDDVEGDGKQVMIKS